MPFPLPGVYYIRSVGSDCYANTIGQDFLLSGTEERHQKWRLEYLAFEGENERACILSEVDSVGDVGLGYLNTVAVENNERVCRLFRPQIWFLEKQEDGTQEDCFRICQFRNDIPLAWSFGEEDEQDIVVLSDDPNCQRWAFELVE